MRMLFDTHTKHNNNNTKKKKKNQNELMMKCELSQGLAPHAPFTQLP